MLVACWSSLAREEEEGRELADLLTVVGRFRLEGEGEEWEPELGEPELH